MSIENGELNIVWDDLDFSLSEQCAMCVDHMKQTPPAPPNFVTTCNMAPNQFPEFRGDSDIDDGQGGKRAKTAEEEGAEPEEIRRMREEALKKAPAKAAFAEMLDFMEQDLD